jgi:protein-disulfide isomerase
MIITALTRTEMAMPARPIAMTTTLRAGGIAMMALGLLCLLPSDGSMASEAMNATASPLGDMIVGSDDAPVTVVEYASMTCTHCATFHRDIYPELKVRYIDTGKVRFILREFPLDIKAAAGAMLARCVAKGDAAIYFATVAALFRLQDDWVPAKSAVALKRIAKQAGLGEQESDACLGNTELLAGIKQTRDDAVAKLNVKSTPSFFVNGVTLVQNPTLEFFEKVIEPKASN